MAKRSQEHGYRKPLREPMLRGELSAWFGWSPERLALADVLAGWRSALARRGAPGAPATVQLYVHFAFCQASCAFCQYFHVVPRDPRQVRDYVDYLVALLGRYRAALGRVEVSNAYFGGGTPSMLPAAELGRFLEAFARTFRVKSELTCEAHPTNLDEEKLALLARAGVNRLSMGLQSLDAAVLRRIARANPPLPRVRELVARARELGMWVNTDLVLGLPGQTPESFLADLDRLLREARPDCLTVYRYQPVPHLSEAPPETMRYSRVLTPAVLLRALRQGYLPATSGGDDRAGKDFLLNSSRTWRQWRDRAAFEVARAVRADVEQGVYALFERNDSHVLGIGSGAMSHLYGYGWYREVTAVAGAGEATEPVYLGTRLTAADECRSALLQAFAAGRWTNLRLLARRSGVDVAATFGELLDAGRRDGALRRAGRWCAPAPGTSPATHPSLFEALLPAAAAAALDVAALRDDAAVQREMVATGDHLPDAARPEGQESDAPRRSDEARLAWSALIGLGAPGDLFAGAIVDRLGDGEAHFRVLPAPAPALRVIVEPEQGQPSFRRAGPYAISYAPRAGEALAPRELQFLLELCARTAAALRLPPETPASPAKDARA